MSEDTLSFDQFQAVRRRRVAGVASSGSLDEKEEDADDALEEKTAEETGREGVLVRLGRLLQSPEVQLIMAVVICADLLSGFYQLYAAARGWKSSFLNILEFQAGMSLLLYATELLMVMIAFRGGIFSSLGYTLDILVVASMFYAVLAAPAETSRDQLAWWPASRLLNFFRLWRVVRMLNAAVEAAEQYGKQARQSLSLATERNEGLKLRVKKAEQAHKREVDKYRRLEQSFRSQRDELDTMREALQIAAQTVARVQGFDAIAGLMGEEERKEFDQVVQEEQGGSRQVASTRRKAPQGDNDDDAAGSGYESVLEDPVADSSNLAEPQAV